MTTPYKPVSWTEGPVRTSALQQMANNDQWLFENTGRMFYYAHGISRGSGIKLMCGYTTLTIIAVHSQSKVQYFPNFFSVGCNPIVVGSLQSPSMGRVNFVVRGIGSEFPDHRGFTVYAAVDEVNPVNNKFYARSRFAWHAMGW